MQRESGWAAIPQLPYRAGRCKVVTKTRRSWHLIATQLLFSNYAITLHEAAGTRLSMGRT